MSTRLTLTLKEKSAKRICASMNALIDKRFLSGICVACTAPVRQRGFALCTQCWKRAPRKYKWQIGEIEKRMSAEARIAEEKPSYRWHQLMRWVIRCLQKQQTPHEAGLDVSLGGS